MVVGKNANQISFSLRSTTDSRYIHLMSMQILIADDHPLFRDALVRIIEMALPDCVIQQATNCAETREQFETANFKLAFVDLDMPDSNGLTDLALLRKISPQIPIIVVSAHDSPLIIRTCLDYGVSGYVLKSSPPAQIKSAVEAVLSGETYEPEQINLSIDDTGNEAEAIKSLTPSQLKVLMEIGKGKLNKQIAYDLSITEATVKAHITSIFKKLGINNRTQAVLVAKQHEASIPNLL